MRIGTLKCKKRVAWQIVPKKLFCQIFLQFAYFLANVNWSENWMTFPLQFLVLWYDERKYGSPDKVPILGACYTEGWYLRSIWQKILLTKISYYSTGLLCFDVFQRRSWKMKLYLEYVCSSGFILLRRLIAKTSRPQSTLLCYYLFLGDVTCLWVYRLIQLTCLRVYQLLIHVECLWIRFIQTRKQNSNKKRSSHLDHTPGLWPIFNISQRDNSRGSRCSQG